MSASSIFIEANGLTFSARVAGPADGEPVLLLHGFPDTADTFDAQLIALGAAGYRAIAPTLRGYEPSSQPADADYSLMTLVSDVVGWLDALGYDRAHLIGHDWGAAITHTLAAYHGDRLHSAATMAVPPIPRLPDAIKHVPRQLRLSWYMNFFQIRGVADAAMRARDGALVGWFWSRWSPGMRVPPAVVATFRRPGVIEAALAYYRQNATPALLLGFRSNPATEIRPVGAPMLILHGDQDGCMDARLFEHTVIDDDFPQGVRRELIAGVGHFLHLEAPDRITKILLDWLAEHARS